VKTNDWTNLRTLQERLRAMPEEVLLGRLESAKKHAEAIRADPLGVDLMAYHSCLMDIKEHQQEVDRRSNSTISDSPLVVDG
jgi:hypothetical protein